MKELSLSALGPFQATLNGQPLEDFRTRKVQALLIYLVVDAQGHSRDSLLELLWPGLPEKSARSNLRQVLYYLRRDLPDVIGDDGHDVSVVIANRQEIRLNQQAAVSVDTWRLETLLDGVDAHDHLELFLCRDCREQLKEAVALYRGDFLSDFYLDDSNEFEEWAQSRREYFRRRALDALSMLATMALRARNFPAAQAYAEKQLEIDNLRESAYRQLMEVLARSGRREQAAAVYESCRRVLAEELGMAPAARTTATYEKIVSGELNLDRAATQGVRGYELKEKIGEGAYGTIYMGLQPAILRQVAVKVIHRKYADNAEFIRRFEAEAQTVARLEHPYIVPLYDYWRDPQGAYLVMRYMRGGSLLEQLKAGPLDLERTVTMVDQVGAALAIAHQQGIIHRDIKPGNILLDEAGNAYVADFGIAKDLTGERRLTAEGAMVGSLDYISPEQITGDPVTPQTDIYSLGAVLYETLTGERPFGDTPLAQLLYKQMHEPIPLVTATRPDVPASVDAVIQKATAKAPQERYDSVLEMNAAFRNAVLGAQPEAEEQTFVPALQTLYNPYKGLQSFQEADAEDFFGRDALIRQLLDRLGATAQGPESRFLALVGPSGSGKSSVVKAGLVPALRQGALPGSDKWFIAEMAPGSNPLQELAQALWRVAVDPPPNLAQAMQRDADGILRAIRRVLPGERALQDGAPQLLLIIDQFEELFTLVEDDGQRAFFLDSLLAALAAARSPLRLVVTLRADFYDRPLQIQEWGTLLKQNTEVVLPLNRSELTWAVREPARRVGVRLEEGLASTIVADVADQPGALPLLQYAMTELFERREGRRLTRSRYEQLGGVRGALARQAENLYRDLDAAGQEVARQVFLRLVTLGEGVEDTRRRVLRQELEALSGADPDVGYSQSLASEILDRFGAARFLTFDRDPLTRGPTVEVAHEALLREWPRLRRWLAESRDHVRLQRMLAQATREWEAANHAKGYLLRGSRLDQFASWLESAPVALTSGEHALIAASASARKKRLVAEEERRERELQAARDLADTQQKRAEEQARAAQKLRRRAAYLAVALVVAAILATLALAAGRQSSLNAAEAQTNADLAAVNAAEAQENADAAATNAVQSAANAALAQTREAQEALQRAAAEEAQATAEAAQAAADRERELAEEQARLATSRELALAALNTLDKDPELSILLALQAEETAYTQAAEDALHQSVQQSRLRHAIPGVLGAAFHPGGTRVATINETNLQVWNVAANEAVLTVTLPSEPMSVAYSADGLTVAIGMLDGSITLWDATSGVQKRALAGHVEWAYSVVFSPDGRYLASSGSDGVVILWELESAEAQFTFPGVVYWGSRVSFSPDGTLLAAPELAEGEAVENAVVNLWDTATGRLRMTLTAPAILGITFSPDGAYLGTPGASISDFSIWDFGASLATGAGQPSATLSGHSNPVTSGVFSPDSALLATGSQDGTAKLWDPYTGREHFTLAGHTGIVYVAGFSPDGGRLLTRADDGARIWDVALPGNEEVMSLAGPDVAGNLAMALSPDGGLLALGGVSGDIHLHDALNGELLSVLSGHSPVFRISFSSDGRRLATAGQDGVANVWDVAGSLDSGRGQELLTLRGHDENALIGGLFTGVIDLAFSPDGRRLATAGADGTVRLWDADSGELLDTIVVRPDQAGVWNVAFSPNGQNLAASTEIPEAFVNVWRFAGARLEEQFTLTDFPSRVQNIQFSPDGKQLLTSGANAHLALWDASSGEPIHAFLGHVSTVFDAKFSEDGRIVASTSADTTARIWNVESGVNLLTLSAPTPLRDVALSPDASYLYTSNRDGELRVYALRLDTLVDLAHSRLTRWWTPEECRQYLHRETCPEKKY